MRWDTLANTTAFRVYRIRDSVVESVAIQVRRELLLESLFLPLRRRFHFRRNKGSNF